MVFVPARWVPQMPYYPPDSLTIEQFVSDDTFRPTPLNASRPAFIANDGNPGHRPNELLQRVEFLSRALSSTLNWNAEEGGEWDKVVGVFTLNTPDFLTACWSVHRLGGVCTPANAAYSAQELAYQLESSGATVLLTCSQLLPTALIAARAASIPESRIFLFDKPSVSSQNLSWTRFRCLEDLILFGSTQPAGQWLRLEKGEGATRTAFLCYSSGTSGLPKGVRVTHRNMISNLVQMLTNEQKWRQELAELTEQSPYTEIGLDCLPQSHIYGLVYICTLAFFRGDEVIVMPKYDFIGMLEAIQKYRINTLPLAPPIITTMAKNEDLLSQYDLSSVRFVITGAAPLGAETSELLLSQHPSWTIRQGYGLTETATVVSTNLPIDNWQGSSGMLLPGYEARLVAEDGTEIETYDTPGELLLKSPSIVPGYFRNEKANDETFIAGCWLRTGDVAEFRVSPRGNEHIWIVDRKKELIKVKGNQVAPAELEAHLRSHPSVADCAVIGILDDMAGELPKAFIVKRGPASEAKLRAELDQFVKDHKAKYKWLKGGIQFIDEIPTSPSGKILRRQLRDREMQKEKEARTEAIAKL